MKKERLRIDNKKIINIISVITKIRKVKSYE